MEKRDEAETTENLVVWEALKSIICNNIDYYAKDESTNGLKLHAAFLGIIDQLEEARPLLDTIQLFCKDFDYDENTPGNGYRSFIKVFDAAINHTSKIVKHVTENRASLLFRKNNYTKEVEACNHMLGAMVTLLHHLETLHSWSADGCLFPAQEQSPEDILERARSVNQFAFYGRCLGFHFCDSIKPVLKFIAIYMASYSESYYSTNGRFIKATNSMFTGGKYLFDPELLSRRIVNLSNNSQIDFCKSFWFCAENEIMNTISLVSHGVKVNRLMKITTETLKVSTSDGDEIEVPAVGQIKVRLLSAHKREGMVGDKKSAKGEKNFPKSKSLLLHVHGGGFVSQSSKSHLVYLNEWANALNVPIFSIDYSLAPESPYPRALNEVFYAYCWALKNCELLGSTCEKVVFVGDSAGANICLAALLKCIDMKIRKPNGIFIAYCPVLVGFDPSPSRLLCMMDPLLPFGFMMRCLKAYSHSKKDYADDEKRQLQKLEEMKRAKADRNEELKRKASNPDCDQDLVFSEDEKTDSFEEISCFERHQTDSNLQAHISQVSDVTDVTSNDTLAGASFLTGTDNRNSIVHDTIEIISPIDSIRSATSLEEDSLPITIQKNEKRASATFDDIDLPPSTSHHSDEITQSHRKYVDDYIEKYVLDAQQNDDGSIKPILRKASHTQSEENIVFDISRDTLSVQNFQAKVTRVATTIVDTVSSTITQITTSNRPIIRNLSIDAADEVRMLNNESVPTSPTADFIFTVPKDPFMSPFYAEDDMLVQFPSIKIVTLSLDPFFDDNIFFAKKLRDLNVDVQLDIVDGLPHGFLNFSRLSKDAHEATKLSMARIADLLHITLDQDETKVKYFC